MAYCIIIFINLFLFALDDPFYGCPKKLYLILRLNFGLVNFSMTKMLVIPDSEDMYKSFRIKVLAFMP